MRKFIPTKSRGITNDAATCQLHRPGGPSNANVNANVASTSALIGCSSDTSTSHFEGHLSADATAWTHATLPQHRTQ
ncbi:uncharacterized protein LOC144115174 isoform X2 [Amblyomma americanum]